MFTTRVLAGASASDVPGRHATAGRIGRGATTTSPRTATCQPEPVELPPGGVEMTDEEMDQLATLTGPDLDRMWMEMMIAHHQGAITMAATEQAEGSSHETTALASDIIAAQEAEIDEMQGLLGP